MVIAVSGPVSAIMIGFSRKAWISRSILVSSS